MEKNWLIRTKNNHILGPVSKAKVRELVKNGSIKGEDELCSGNGFWFFVREKDLVELYLMSDTPQPFNPVSEADTVLAGTDAALRKTKEEANQASLNQVDDITTVGLNISDLQDEKKK